MVSFSGRKDFSYAIRSTSCTNRTRTPFLPRISHNKFLPHISSHKIFLDTILQFHNLTNNTESNSNMYRTNAPNTNKILDAFDILETINSPHNHVYLNPKNKEECRRLKKVERDLMDMHYGRHSTVYLDKYFNLNTDNDNVNTKNEKPWDPSSTTVNSQNELKTDSQLQFENCTAAIHIQLSYPNIIYAYKHHSHILINIPNTLAITIILQP